MNMKAPLKYQLHDYRSTHLIMYLCVYLVVFLEIILNLIKFEGNFYSNSLETVSAVTIFIVGLNSFKEYFKFFSANGVSRKTKFLSTSAALGILSVAFAFFDTINSILFTHITNYFPLYYMIYHIDYKSALPLTAPVLTPQILLVNFFWLAFLYLLLSMAGLFITTLYYRMNKVQKIVVSIAVPLLFLNSIPDFDFFFLGGRITSFIGNAFRAAMGLSNGSNPYIAMFSMFLSAAVFAGLAFLLARKADVKK